MGHQHFYGEGPHPLLRVGVLATRGKITLSVKPNRPNYCGSFIVYTQFGNVTASSMTHPGGPWVVDPCSKIVPSFVRLVDEGTE
jgi:hypothetical protein